MSDLYADPKRLMTVFNNITFQPTLNGAFNLSESR